MITEQQLDEQGERVNALAEQIRVLKDVYREEARKLTSMIADKAIADMKMAKLASYVVNMRASLQILPSATETPLNGDLTGLGHVRAMLTQRGFSSGSYAVLAETETRYQIEISSDPAKSMKYWISKARCEKVDTVARKAA
jgi:hypothetical protein